MWVDKYRPTNMTNYYISNDIIQSTRKWITNFKAKKNNTKNNVTTKHQNLFI